MEKSRNLRELVLADLERAQRLILKIQDVIDPQFRIATPKGDYWIAMTLAADEVTRLEQMQKISLFMAWKQALGFTLATELVNPDAVYAVGVTPKECVAAVSLISRKPITFGPVEWIGREGIGDDVRDLLPQGPVPFTPAMVRELEAYFGPDGKFPAVHIATGRLGL